MHGMSAIDPGKSKFYSLTPVYANKIRAMPDQLSS